MTSAPHDVMLAMRGRITLPALQDNADRLTCDSSMYYKYLREKLRSACFQDAGHDCAFSKDPSI